MKAARAKTKQVVLIRVSLLEEKQHPKYRRGVFRKTKKKFPWGRNDTLAPMAPGLWGGRPRLPPWLLCLCSD